MTPPENPMMTLERDDITDALNAPAPPAVTLQQEFAAAEGNKDPTAAASGSGGYAKVELDLDAMKKAPTAPPGLELTPNQSGDEADDVEESKSEASPVKPVVLSKPPGLEDEVDESVYSTVGKGDKP